MKKEEAIEWLKEMKDTIELYNALSNSYTFDKYPQAIDMAIEALTNQQKWIDEELQNYLIEHADLVTCKDCKHAETCSQNVAVFESYKMYEPIDFCSWAERREP